MKKKTLLIITLLSFVACGSGNEEEIRTLQVTIAEPAVLAILPSEERSVALLLGEATISLEKGSDGVYRGQTPALAPGSYPAELVIAYPADLAELEGLSVDDADGSGDIPLAVYEITITVVAGENVLLIDVAPSDFSTDLDHDSDGVINLNEIVAETDPFDEDSDDDGIPDGIDIFPSVSTESADSDGDEIGNNADNCVNASNPDQIDLDADGAGDACDPDDDADGLLDEDEVALGTDPRVADTDGDAVADGSDNCPLLTNSDQNDTDDDGAGNACDDDDDADGIADPNDNCPFLASPNQTDTDSDGVGDVCTDDDDGDGVIDSADNCRVVANTGQLDTDADGQGDACDSDDDNDGLSDTEEGSAGVDSLVTNGVSADTDGDGLPDNLDNCPLTANADQESIGDADGEGDACDCAAEDNTIVTNAGIFVSASLGDDNQSGARNAPVKTIGQGIALAASLGKTHVYVAAGTYRESVTIVSGISVFVCPIRKPAG